VGALVRVGRERPTLRRLDGEHRDLAVGLGGGHERGLQLAAEDVLGTFAGAQEVRAHLTGQAVVGRIAASLGVGEVGPVLHLELLLGAAELLERGRTGRTRREGATPTFWPSTSRARC
jgi:hypothetical protein